MEEITVGFVNRKRKCLFLFSIFVNLRNVIEINIMNNFMDSIICYETWNVCITNEGNGIMTVLYITYHMCSIFRPSMTWESSKTCPLNLWMGTFQRFRYQSHGQHYYQIPVMLKLRDWCWLYSLNRNQLLVCHIFFFLVVS